MSSAADTGEENAPFSLSSDVRPLARPDMPKGEGVAVETGKRGLTEPKEGEKEDTERNQLRGV